MKNKILLPILLLAAMTVTGCGKQPVSSSEQPGPASSDVQPTTSEEQPPVSSEDPVSSSEAPSSSEDPVTYGVAINNKAQLTGEWYKGTTRDLDITLTPAANALQEIQKGNLTITSSDPTVVAVTGLGLNALAKGQATITVKYHDATDTVAVNILSNSAKDKYGVAHDGTEDDPFTNEDALVVAKSDKYEQEVYYVKGKVASFYNAPGSRTDGMVAYFLEPATTGGEKFEIYKCFKEDGSPLTDDDIWVGGEATAYGSFTKYGSQYETSSAVFVSCTGNKPQPRQTLEKTFAETLALGQALPDGGDSYDYIKFQGYVTKREGNNYFLTATKGEAIVSGKSDEAHGSRDIYTNAIELYNAGKVADLVAKLLEGAKVEVTMLVKNYHGTVENGLDLKNEDVVVKEAGTQWAVPEPAVGNATIAEFKALQNTKAKAYNVTGSIKSFKNGATKDEYGNMVLQDGAEELIIYGATMTASALAWDNAGAYAFTNPKDFISNATSNALAVGTVITMKLVRNDYTSGGNTTIEGVGVIVDIQAVAATGIELDKSELEVEEGSTAQLVASILPAGATGVVTWESSAEAVATVSANGVVLGVAAGTATITAKLGEFSATCAVTVKASSVVTNLERATSIAVGDRLVLACDNGTVKKQFNGIVAAGSNKIGEAVDYTGVVPAEDKAIIEVVAGKNEGTFGFKLDDKYICWTSGNTLNVQDAIDENSSWTVTFADGNATIANVKDSARKLQYNAGSPRFCAYTSAQTAVQLWKFKAAVTPTPAEMVLPIIAKGNQDTKVEGAGAWIYIDTTGLSLTAEMANAMAAAAQIQLTVAMSDETPDGVKDAAQHYITGADAAVVLDGTVRFDDFGTNTVRLYVGMDKGLDNTWKMKHTFQISIPLDATTVFVGSVEFVGGALTKINDEAYVAPVVIAQPTGTFFASAELTDDGKTALGAAGNIVPVFITLGVDSASVNVDGASAGACSIKSYDQSNGWLVITTAAFGDLSMQYNPETKDLEKLSVVANTGILKYDGGQSLKGNEKLKYWNCDGTTEELQAQWNRRYGDPWTLDTNNADRVTQNTEFYKSGSAMRLRPYADNRFALATKDFSEPFNARNISFWVYNSGTADATIQCFAYKSTGYSNFIQPFSNKTIPAGQWTYVSAGFTATDLYGFQIFVSKTASALIFDDICLF